MVACKCLKTMGMSRSGIPKVVMVACKSFQQESSDNENWVSHQWCMVAKSWWLTRVVAPKYFLAPSKRSLRSEMFHHDKNCVEKKRSGIKQSL